jgi:hypothetical protein
VSPSRFSIVVVVTVTVLTGPHGDRLLQCLPWSTGSVTQKRGRTHNFSQGPAYPQPAPEANLTVTVDCLRLPVHPEAA